MKIAVIGGTRGIGLSLVKAALTDGHAVTVLARNPDKMPLRDARLQVVQGDAQNSEDIAKVIHGQDVVCDCLGTNNVVKRITLFSTSAENLSKALKPEQLLIAITGIGTGDSKGHGGFLYDNLILPIVLRRIYADKDRQEQIIKSKIARWIIVRPGFLTNGPRTGRYRTLTNLTGVKTRGISRDDVADFMLAQAKTAQFIGQTVLITR